MHSMGLHSALAIKRQRKRRADLKKAKGRRYSIQSTESGLGGSQSSCASPRNSLDGTERSGKKTIKNKVTSFESNVGIGMLQIGVVFIVLGVFLLGSTLIPDDFDDWSWQNVFTKKAWWNELVITGAFALLLGVFLIVLDKFISKKEEDDLNEYVQGQLTRSRSGHRLVRDIETGNLVPKRTKTLTAINDNLQQELEELPVVHSPKIKSPPANYSSSNQIFMNGETGMLSPQLEKILEEDISVFVDDHRTTGLGMMHEEYDSTTASVSPGSVFEAHETQELIGTIPYTTVPPSSKYHQVSALHLAVVSLLLGAVILIVGLVQLKPGADAPGHRYYLIAVGCFLKILGLIITATRCVMLHLKIKKRRSSTCSSNKKCEKIIEASSSQIEGNEPSILVNGKSQNTLSKDSLSPPDGVNQKHLSLKQLYNSSDVMYIDELSDAATDRKSKSPVESVNTIDVVTGGTNQESVPSHFTETCSLAMVSPIDLDNFLSQKNQGSTT